MKGVCPFTEKSVTHLDQNIRELRSISQRPFLSNSRCRILLNTHLHYSSALVNTSGLMDDDMGIEETGNCNNNDLAFICAHLRQTTIGDVSGSNSGMVHLDSVTTICFADDITIDGPAQTLPADVEKVYKQDADGDTLLHVAIILGKEDEASGFINIAIDSDLLSIQNFICQSPLHLATLTRQHRVVRRLVVGGASLESRDKTGNTPLHIACRERSVEIVDALIEPISMEEKQQNRYETVIEDINHIMEIPNYDGLPCIHVAAEQGHYDLVRYLIFKGADINSIDRKSGRTLLHKAAIDGNTELVQMLTSFQTCNINAKAFDDNTPFDFARDREYHSITFELAAEATRRTKAESQ